ncbi:MAG: hypothetical protein RR951_06450 [Ruthenibacterium sp.]
MGKKKELFATAVRGFDKEEVLLYLNELIELHAAEKAKLETALKMAMRKLDAARLAQSSKENLTAQPILQLNTEKENLQNKLQQLKASEAEQARTLQACQKEIARLREENARAAQTIADRQPGDAEEEHRAAQQVQKMLESAQQECNCIINEAQAQASVLMLHAQTQSKVLAERESILQFRESQLQARMEPMNLQGEAMALTAIEEQEETLNSLAIRKRRLEAEMQQLLYKISLCKTFLQQTDHAVRELYDQWGTDSRWPVDATP